MMEGYLQEKRNRNAEGGIFTTLTEKDAYDLIFQNYPDVLQKTLQAAS